MRRGARRPGGGLGDGASVRPPLRAVPGRRPDPEVSQPVSDVLYVGVPGVAAATSSSSTRRAGAPRPLTSRSRGTRSRASRSSCHRRSPLPAVLPRPWSVTNGSSGGPVASATVVTATSPSPTTLRSLDSDDFTANLTAGTYGVEVSAPSYQNLSTSLGIGPQNLAASFALTPLPPPPRPLPSTAWSRRSEREPRRRTRP